MFEVTGGQINDLLLGILVNRQALNTKNLIADKGYDSEAIREQMSNRVARR